MTRSDARSGPKKATSDRVKSVTLPQAPTLRVQSVLYANRVGELSRSMASLGRAIEHAVRAGVVASAVVALGDCSPTRVLDDPVVESFRSLLRLQGVTHFEYTFFDANLGSAAGQNQLFTSADCDLVLILNPDTVVAPDAIVELAGAIRQPGVGLAEARQLPLEHPKDYDPETGDTSWAATACALVPAPVFAEVRGFDPETFFLYCDDVDFSWRIRLAGYRVVHQPSARLFHDKRLDVKGGWQVSPAEEYYSAEAALLLAYKFSRPDLVSRMRANLTQRGSELQRKAVTEFDRRQRSGELPTPVDREHRVGQFIDGNYAVHRF